MHCIPLRHAVRSSASQCAKCTETELTLKSVPSTTAESWLQIRDTAHHTVVQRASTGGIAVSLTWQRGLHFRVMSRQLGGRLLSRFARSAGQSESSAAAAPSTYFLAAAQSGRPFSALPEPVEGLRLPACPLEPLRADSSGETWMSRLCGRKACIFQNAFAVKWHGRG